MTTVFCPCLGQKSEAAKINARITRWIEIENRRSQLEYKILLLGTGEAGKSTFLRQMRILHGEGYSEKQRLDYKKWIVRNVFLAIQSLINAVELLGLSFNNGRESMEMAEMICKVDCWSVEQFEPPSILHAIKTLWDNEPAILECYSRRNEYDLTDSARYFLSDLDRISQEDYIPSQNDVLHLRIPTTGIIEYVFDIPYRRESVKLRIVDVGGQKTERRKWVHCFEEVKTVIFLAAISEFDQRASTPKDDLLMTRLEDSMELFHVIFSKFQIYFRKAGLILFLNKKDLFEEKISQADNHFLEYFPDFSGSVHDPEATRSFVLSKFVQLLPERRQESMYHHFTCATDTKNIKNIFIVVRQRILQEHLREIGLR